MTEDDMKKLRFICKIMGWVPGRFWDRHCGGSIKWNTHYFTIENDNFIICSYHVRADWCVKLRVSLSDTLLIEKVRGWIGDFSD